MLFLRKYFCDKERSCLHQNLSFNSKLSICYKIKSHFITLLLLVITFGLSFDIKLTKAFADCIVYCMKYIYALCLTLYTLVRLKSKNYNKGAFYQYLSAPAEIQNNFTDLIGSQESYFLNSGRIKDLNSSIEISQNTETIHDLGYENVNERHRGKSSENLLDLETMKDLKIKFETDFASVNPKMTEDKNSEFTTKKIYEWRPNEKEDSENESFTLRNNVAYFKMGLFEKKLNIPSKGAIIIDLSQSPPEKTQKTDMKATKYSELEFKKEGYTILPGKSYNFFTKSFDVNK